MSILEKHDGKFERMTVKCDEFKAIFVILLLQFNLMEKSLKTLVMFMLKRMWGRREDGKI